MKETTGTNQHGVTQLRGRRWTLMRRSTAPYRKFNYHRLSVLVLGLLLTVADRSRRAARHRLVKTRRSLSGCFADLLDRCSADTVSNKAA
jgi:hypothetical protein